MTENGDPNQNAVALSVSIFVFSESQDHLESDKSRANGATLFMGQRQHFRRYPPYTTLRLHSERIQHPTG